MTHARGNDAHQGWQGRRIMDIGTKRVTTIGDGYDNFPLWSPRGDLIMFSRRKDDVLAVG